MLVEVSFEFGSVRPSVSPSVRSQCNISEFVCQFFSDFLHEASHDLRKVIM